MKPLLHTILEKGWTIVSRQEGYAAADAIAFPKKTTTKLWTHSDFR